MRRKFVAWSLLAALAAGSLSACGETTGTGGTEGGTVSSPPVASDAGSGTGTGTGTEGSAGTGTGTGMEASASASTAP